MTPSILGWMCISNDLGCGSGFERKSGDGSHLETQTETILEFVHGLRGSLHASFQEGTCAAWLHDLLQPRVTEVLVCDSRKNALLRVGNKSDREDARKLAELLFLNKPHPVYHGEAGIRTLKELARSYLTITRDLTRVMNRLKAIYRGWGIVVPASKCMHLATVLDGCEDHGSRRAPPRRDLLSTVRCLSGFTSGSAPRTFSGSPETYVLAEFDNNASNSSGFQIQLIT